MKIFAWIIFSSFLIYCPWGFAQSPGALGARKVQDYFQDVESKSYYQQERIRSMKGEMNEYSERLHGLQEKFHKIFYGKSTDELHETPFGDRDKISYPKRKYRDPVPIDEVESIVRRPFKISKPQSESNQLAFSVDQSDASPSLNDTERHTENDVSQSKEFAKQNEMQSSKAVGIPSITENSKLDNTRLGGLGGYLILKPAAIFPFKDRTSHQSPSTIKHRKYKPGVAVTLSGGYRFKNWNFGAGALYRRNEHETSSFESQMNNVKPLADGSKSMTVAGFFEVGYTHSLNDWFGLMSSLGLGYGVSFVEDFAPFHSPGEDRTRLDPFFYASGGISAVFTPTDFLAISLGYRYFHEDEVPAHAAEVGLVGKF